MFWLVETQRTHLVLRLSSLTSFHYNVKRFVLNYIKAQVLRRPEVSLGLGGPVQW